LRTDQTARPTSPRPSPPASGRRGGETSMPAKAPLRPSGGRGVWGEVGKRRPGQARLLTF
jgi:hypothetical protein